MKTSVYLFALILIGTHCIAQSPKRSGNKKFPLEHVTIAGKVKGTLSKEELLNSEGLYFSSAFYHIIGFKIILVTAKNSRIQYTNEANGQLTSAMREGIKNEMNLSKVSFENIKCADKNGFTRPLAPLTFNLK